MFKCNCGKEYEKRTSLNTHARFCDKYIKVEKRKSIYKINDNLYKCECDREFDNHQSLNVHFSHCLIHRNGKPSSRKYTHTTMLGWDKFTDDEIAEIHKKSGITLAEKIKNGEITPHWIGKKHTVEAKNKISISRHIMQDINNYYCLWYEVFNGEKIIKVQGTWERDVAETLTKNGIKWIRPILVYNIYHRYMPDFFLPEFNMYIEVKGRWNERDILKTKIILLEYPDINLRIIDSKQEINGFINNKITIFDFKHIKELKMFNKNSQVSKLV